MNDTHGRLTRCFLSVFSGLDAREAQQASAASLTRWDSVSHIMLLSVVAEEFGIEFAPEDYERLNSFASIEQAIAARQSA